MNILIATGLYPPDIGGPATYTVFLEKHLPKCGITYVTVPYSTVRSYPKLFRHFMYLVKLLKKGRRADMLYALDTISVGLPVRIASALLRKPYLLRVPGDYAWEQGQQRYGVTETLDEYLLHRDHHYMVRLLRRIQAHVARHARHIIVPSEYMKGVVRAWGVPKNRVTRVYTELKEITVPESKEELRKEYGYEGLIVSTAARLVPWKGVDRVIQAVQVLRERGLPVSLEIIGDGPLRKKLEEQVLSLGASAYIHFLGAVSHQEVGRRVKAADVFALNTSYEGLSHHIIEAMSLETPVVTTPVGGNGELITHEETGLLVPHNDTKLLADALTRLHENPSYGREIAARARTVVQRFHEDTVIQSFITLLRSLWKS